MPPTDLHSVFDAALRALDAQHLRRERRVVAPGDGADLQADGRTRLAFAGNDYLGLARHPTLADAARRGAAQYGVGATASPLVCGHSPAHAALEDELARFVGLPRALYFYAGYAANTGAIPALVGRGDVVLSDALNHACLIDGARLSRAEIVVYPHNDLAALDAGLARACGARRRLVCVDAVFSMDGDLAPLAELLALCERHDAWLYVDDAHGFGVLGDGGRGSLSQAFGLGSADAASAASAERSGAVGLHGIDAPAGTRGSQPGSTTLKRLTARLVYMATLGKAAGVAGAFVAGAPAVIDWLAQTARPYFFATGAPPMVAEALRASLRLIEADGWRRERIAALRAQLGAGLATLPWSAPASACAIQPVLLGSAATALAVMRSLDTQGIWVPAIRPPTVPEGTSRLRISLSALHTPDDVARLLAALATAAAAIGADADGPADGTGTGAGAGTGTGTGTGTARD